MDLSSTLAGLESLSSPHVHVATPAHRVEVEESAGQEVLAVVRETLSNVAAHVGADADAWVLLEALDENLIVSVRDEGPGIPAGRLELAASEGRLGITESIQGRLKELGGQATLATGSWGTEWEFTVPLRHSRRSPGSDR